MLLVEALIAIRYHALLETIDVTVPPAIYPNVNKLGGTNSNALVLTPDARTLLVSNGGENAIAVIRLSDRASDYVAKHRKDADDDDAPAGQSPSAVIGLVPTSWYPTGVATSRDGRTWDVINAKGETSANALACQGSDDSAASCKKEQAVRAGKLITRNQFVFQLEHAGFLTFPAPNQSELARLTLQVARNNRFDEPDLTAADRDLSEFLHQHTQHVIYIIKENRSYDQVLGDLDVRNGDPRLTLFAERTSPNHYAIARNLVTADHSLVTGEVSGSGWDRAVSAQANDYRELQEPLTTAHRGMDGEATGFNRNINIGYRTSRARHAERSEYPSDSDILPSERDVTALDGPGGEEGTHVTSGTIAGSAGSHLGCGSRVQRENLWCASRPADRQGRPPRKPCRAFAYNVRHRKILHLMGALFLHHAPEPAAPVLWNAALGRCASRVGPEEGKAC